MKTILCALAAVFLMFGQAHASSELGTDEGTTDTSNPSLRKAKGYDQKCSAQDKKERIELYEKCSRDFTSMDLPKVPNPNDLRPKYSCSKVEGNSMSQAGLGCLAYAFRLPAGVLQGVSNILEKPQYDAVVKKKCGPKPQARESKKITASMPDGQKRVESLGRNERYKSQIEAWSKCYGKVVKAYDEEQAVKSANHKSVMKQSLNYCLKTNPALRRQVNSIKKSKSGKNQADSDLRACRINAMATLNLSCDSCVRELSGGAENPKKSFSFNRIMRSVKLHVGGAWKCYTPKKLGEIACKVAAAAAGSGAAALKLRHAVGQKAAQNIMKDTASLADDAKKTKAIATAKAAASGAGDTPQSRQKLGEAVLRKEGLLGKSDDLSPAQSDALWRAHQLPDDQIAQKARILSEPVIDDNGQLIAKEAFTKEQRAALLRGRDDLGGNGVSGGHQGYVSGQINTAPFSVDNPLTRRTTADLQKELNGRNVNNAFVKPASADEFEYARELYEARGLQFAKDPSRGADARVNLLNAGRPVEYVQTFSTSRSDFVLSPGRKALMEADIAALKQQKAAIEKFATDTHNAAMVEAKKLPAQTKDWTGGSAPQYVNHLNASSNIEARRWVAGEGAYSPEYVEHMKKSIDQTIKEMELALANQ